MAEITLRREKEHAAFTELYRAAELELGENWTKANCPVFSVAAREGAKLLGAATVSRRYGRLILDYIAVWPEARGRGLGRKLAEACLRYAAEEGEAALWLAARNASFFRAMGARETGGRELLADCRTCPDYETVCRPMEMKFAVLCAPDPKEKEPICPRISTD